MLKKIISYTDFNDTQKTKTLYFNLTQPEISVMPLFVDEGFTEVLERIKENKDVAGLVTIFTDLIKAAYGVKSDDGEIFRKSHDLSEEFSQSAAYEALFVELLNGDDNTAIDFFTALIPKKAAEAVKAQQIAEKVSYVAFDTQAPQLVHPDDPAFKAMQMASVPPSFIPPLPQQ